MEKVSVALLIVPAPAANAEFLKVIVRPDTLSAAAWLNALPASVMLAIFGLVTLRATPNVSPAGMVPVTV
jgi:hypothetical protein